MTNLQNKAALPKDLKQRNRSEILKAVQNSPKEEWSLAGLSEYTGISRATVAKAVSAFVKKGIFNYKGKGNSTEIGGKRPDVYTFNREYQFLAYLNIGIGKLAMAILDLKLEERGTVEVLIPSNTDVEGMIGISRGCYECLLEETGVVEEKIYGLCVSTSGMVNQETGVLQRNLSYSDWGREIPLKAYFEAAYPGMQIMVENVARATGRAELYYNRDLEDKKVFTVFTFRGISGCLIDHGKVQNSRNSLIGEIGHMIVSPDEEDVCRCGSHGCFEQMVSEERLLKKMNEDPNKLEGSALKFLENVRLKDILAEANRGDRYACELADGAARYFAMAFRNVILTVDPEVIVIQGRYSAGGDYFRARLKEHLYNQAYFPETSDWTFLYDERDIWKMAEVGMAAAMADELFKNRELYKD